MPRSGTLVICVQNLDFSGANQVVLNIVGGKMHESNVVVLSPKNGTFGARFVETGAAVRVGDLEDLLHGIRDVFCIVCNTIMTANIVVQMAGRSIPVVWILHEWWTDEMIKDNLKMRNYKGLTLDTVKKAMSVATKVVCVCEAQRQLYSPQASSTVIYVGVPDPIPRQPGSLLSAAPIDYIYEKIQQPHTVFTFLCLGIVCPRKNQMWTIELFKKFAKNKSNVRLQIVGARYTRVYEMEYLEKVKEAIKDDPRIELHDVTDHVEQYYKSADCLILTSLNEVTPMVISESLSWGIPVLSTNIAGIKEMFEDGKEGFMFEPGDEKKALDSMEFIYGDESRRRIMSANARCRFVSTFDLDHMVELYRKLVLAVAPPVILLDMDGTLVDWDQEFHKRWHNKCRIDRAKSFNMEQCVEPAFVNDAISVNQESGFFANLQWIEGAFQALVEMEEEGFQLYIVSSVLQNSEYCIQEKIDWVREHLGESWVDKLILTQDKTTVAGDLLIDDKPYQFMFPNGKYSTATWRQIIFDQPYNRQIKAPRLCRWADWKKIVHPMLGKLNKEQIEEISQIDAEAKKELSSISLRRQDSFSTITSIGQLQKEFDKMHFSDAPLRVEDAATIISNSFALVDGDYESDEERLETFAAQEDQYPQETKCVDEETEHMKSLAEKKRQLQKKQALANSEYQEGKLIHEKIEAMNTEEEDMDGFQLFNPTYQRWKKKNTKSNRKTSVPVKMF